MEELGRRVGKIWRACDSPSTKTVLHTCSDLFKAGQNSSYLFPPLHSCSQLFTPVHTCSHLFTPVHTSVTIYALHALQFLVEFSPCESCYFSILRVILLKLHVFAHLIESWPTVYGLSSCIEIKLSIPLETNALY